MAQLILAYCGLVCSECPYYLATQNNDQAKLQQIAEETREKFGLTVTAAECMCDGCIGEGRKISYCDTCAVRPCAIAHGVPTCAHCADYATCATIGAFLEQVPEAKTRLDQIRLSLR